MTYCTVCMIHTVCTHVYKFILIFLKNYIIRYCNCLTRIFIKNRNSREREHYTGRVNHRSREK